MKVENLNSEHQKAIQELMTDYENKLGEMKQMYE